MLSRMLSNKRWLFLPAGVLLFVGLCFIINARPAYGLDRNGCLQCHGNPDLSTTNGDGQRVSLYVNEERVNTAAHRYIDCTTCHTTKPHEQSNELTKKSLAEQCGTCHQYEYELHVQSIHGQQIMKGNTDAATCVDCHSNEANPHSVIRTLEYTAPTYKKNIAGTCAVCHAQEQLMSSYGIVEKVYESYMRSFHGKAMQLGTYEPTELDKATCTNCHGVHDIKATDDPTSPVAGVENLARTCESCHPGGGVKFASGFLGHKEASPQNIPVAHYTEVFFTFLLISVVAFGVIVMLLATRKYIANKWRESK